MRLRDTLPCYQEFLGHRLVSRERGAWLTRMIERDLFLALGRDLLQGPRMVARCVPWISILRPQVARDERYALNGFERYLAHPQPRTTLGGAIDGYLRTLRRRRCGDGTRKVHRRALRRLAGFIAAETAVSAIPARVWSTVLRRLLSPRPHVLGPALRHYVAFLAHDAITGLPLAALRRTPAPERRLRQCIDTADQRSGFAAALGRYLRALRDERQLSLPHLLDIHARLLRFWRVVHRCGRKKPAQVTAEDVARYRDQAIARGDTQVHAHLSIIRRFFTFLCREEELNENPAQEVRAKVRRRPRRTPLTLAELRALLAAPLQDLARLPLLRGNPFEHHPRRFVALRDHALLALLVETGLRPVEVRALALPDVDLARGVITVRGKGSRTSSTRARQAFLESREVLDALQAYVRIRPLGPATALFLSRRSAPLTAFALIDIVQRRARQAGLARPVRPYDLRVSFASRLVARGADPFALRVLMGHDNIETTFGLYTTLTLDEVRDVWRETNPLNRPVPERGEV